MYSSVELYLSDANTATISFVASNAKLIVSVLLLVRIEVIQLGDLLSNTVNQFDLGRYGSRSWKRSKRTCLKIWIHQNIIHSPLLIPLPCLCGLCHHSLFGSWSHASNWSLHEIVQIENYRKGSLGVAYWKFTLLTSSIMFLGLVPSHNP